MNDKDKVMAEATRYAEPIMWLAQALVPLGELAEERDEILRRLRVLLELE